MLFRSRGCEHARTGCDWIHVEPRTTGSREIRKFLSLLNSSCLCILVTNFSFRMLQAFSQKISNSTGDSELSGSNLNWSVFLLQHHFRRCNVTVTSIFQLDHDVCSNYGNWLYSAGIGNDPRQDRKFNVIKQGTDYDADVSYCDSSILTSDLRSTP